MDKELKLLHTIVINGLHIEVYDKDPKEEFWGNKKIYIYDCLSDLSEKERDMIIDYIYTEGFVDDRRTECAVLRGEDYL